MTSQKYCEYCENAWKGEGHLLKKCLKSQEGERPRIFSVSTIVEFITVAMFLDDKIIFRGQTAANADWALVPSVGRNPDRSELLAHERDILNEFKRESIPYIDFVPKNEWQWLALAQHNRLPTRLLDWAKNPLAALWFAVKDTPVVNAAKGIVEPGVVWGLHNYEGANIVYNKTRSPESPFEIERTGVYFPEHVFPSIQAQSSVFTVHHRESKNPGVFPPLETIITDSDLLLEKIEIAAHAFVPMRSQLLRLGVNAASLFPGLAGLVDRIRYEKMLCKDERSISEVGSTDSSAIGEP
jgi:hypothetical protein